MDQAVHCSPLLQTMLCQLLLHRNILRHTVTAEVAGEVECDQVGTYQET